MSSTDTIKLTIDEKAHSYAKIYASLLSDEFQRKRAYASIVALYSFINLLEKTPYELQKAMTLFRNPMLNEQYEISDLYVNNWHLDVRIVTGGEAVLLPKIHFDNNIAADFYIIIKVNSALTTAELVGIADSKTVKKEPFDYHYLSVNFNELINYDEFLNKIKDKKICNFTQEEHNLFRESYLGLMDNEIDKELKNKLLQHLFNCNECRTEFCCFTGFEMVSCNVSKYPDLLEDQTLSIIGAQNVDDKKYEGKEETIYIGEEKDNSEDSAENDKEAEEETVSDILDELFNDDNDFIADDTIQERPMGASVIEPLKEEDDSNELKIIEDNSREDLSLVENNPHEEMQIIYDEKQKTSDEKDFELVEEPETNILKDDIEILDTENNNFSDDISILSDDIEPINDEDDKIVEDNVQKVIVDYDEAGEPIYSYITNVNPKDAESIESEIEPIDDIDENTFDDYPDDNISEIQPADNIELLEDIPEENDNTLTDTTDKTQAISKPDNEKTDQIESDLNNNNPDISNDYDLEYKEIDDTDSSLQDIEEYNEDNQLNDDIEEEGDENPDNNEDDYEDEEEFEDEDDYEENYTKNPKRSSAKVALLVISLLIVLGLASGGTFFLLKNMKNNDNVAANQPTDNTLEIPTQQQTEDMFEQVEENNIEIPVANNMPTEAAPVQQENQQPAEPAPASGSIEVPPLTEQDLLKTQNTPTGDVNKVIVNAFSKGGAPVSLRGINWLCSAELFTDKTFKAYLQNLDNILKLNLRKNILNATEIPKNNSLSVKMAVDNNGILQKVAVADSSGSEQIDNIVLQSINETFEGEKSQILSDSAMKSDIYYLKVVIKL